MDQLLNLLGFQLEQPGQIAGLDLILHADEINAQGFEQCFSFFRNVHDRISSML